MHAAAASPIRQSGSVAVTSPQVCSVNELVDLIVIWHNEKVDHALELKRGAIENATCGPW
jgi:hypothetical protein